MIIPSLLFSFLLFPQQPAPQGVPSDAQNLEYGSVIAWTWLDSSGTPHYKVSLDKGDTWGRTRETSYNIMLRYSEFDPVVDGVLSVPDELTAPENNELWIVQYEAKGIEPFRDEIRAMGGVAHRFLANHANIWRMDSETASKVSKLPFVRWVGAFHPAYKLEDELLVAFLKGELTTRRYHIIVGEWGEVDKDSLTQALSAMDAEVISAIPQGWIVDARLTPGQLLAVVARNEVVGIDRMGDPETDMNIVRQKWALIILRGLAAGMGPAFVLKLWMETLLPVLGLLTPQFGMEPIRGPLPTEHQPIASTFRMVLETPTIAVWLLMRKAFLRTMVPMGTATPTLLS